MTRSVFFVFRGAAALLFAAAVSLLFLADVGYLAEFWLRAPAGSSGSERCGI